MLMKSRNILIVGMSHQVKHAEGFFHFLFMVDFLQLKGYISILRDNCVYYTDYEMINDVLDKPSVKQSMFTCKQDIPRGSKFDDSQFVSIKDINVGGHVK